MNEQEKAFEEFFYTTEFSIPGPLSSLEENCQVSFNAGWQAAQSQPVASDGKMGGRGLCNKCGEWHNNVAYHKTVCEGQAQSQPVCDHTCEDWGICHGRHKDQCSQFNKQPPSQPSLEQLVEALKILQNLIIRWGFHSDPEHWECREQLKEAVAKIEALSTADKEEK